MKSELGIPKAKGKFQPPMVNTNGLHAIAPKRRDRGATWSKGETDLLVDLWADDNVQQELAISAHNSHVYEHLARMLGQKGYDRTANQCQAKIKALKRECLLMQQGKLPRSRLRFIYKILKRMLHILSNRYVAGRHQQITGSSEIEIPPSPVITAHPPPSDALHSSESAQSSSAFQKAAIEEDSTSSLKLGVVTSGQDCNALAAGELSLSGGSDSEFEVSNFVETVELEEEDEELEEEYRFPEPSSSLSGLATPRSQTVLVERLLDRFLGFQQESEKRFIEAEERRQQWIFEHSRRLWQDERQHQLKAFDTFSKLAQQLLTTPSTVPLPSVRRHFSSRNVNGPAGDE